MTAYFARVLAGLEPIAGALLKEDFGISANSTLHRTLQFESDLPLSELIKAGYLEDIFLKLAELRGIGQQRSALNNFSSLLKEIDLQSQLNIIRQLREVPQVPSYSITASFLGKRNYTRWDIADYIKEGISEYNNWQFLDSNNQILPDHDLNLRIIIEGDNALLGLRLARSPMHNRAYKIKRKAATLNSPLANLMLRLAKCDKSDVLLDPFCGVGTVLLEAACNSLTAKIIGADIDSESLDFFIENLAALGKRALVLHADAFSLPLAEASVDVIASDMPWGNQTEFIVKKNTDIRKVVSSEFSRVLKPGGRFVFLSAIPEVVNADGWSDFTLMKQTLISLHGSHANLFSLVKN